MYIQYCIVSSKRYNDFNFFFEKLNDEMYSFLDSLKMELRILSFKKGPMMMVIMVIMMLSILLTVCVRTESKHFYNKIIISTSKSNPIPFSEPTNPIAGLDQRFDSGDNGDNGDNGEECSPSTRLALQSNYVNRVNYVRKHVLDILTNSNFSEPFKLELLRNYRDIIFTESEGIDMYAAGLMDDFEFDIKE